MSKLKDSLSFETTFATYLVDELLGEGGAGRVFGGMDDAKIPVAIKVLSKDRSSADKRSRFKNEIAFLARNTHKNIVTVLDHGISPHGPFYVMRRYDSNLRCLLKTGIQPDRALPVFSQILDGVEAAHLKGVIHRDLKPENILYDDASNTVAVADFGTARFTEDLIVTAVETGPAQRLANFQYAAPEQRAPGNEAHSAMDVYALGLILNELFTGTVAHGTGYRVIGSVSREYAFLDEVVSTALRQNPAERPASIAAMKELIGRHREQAVALQRLSEIDGAVIRADSIDAPLAETPPNLISADWDGNRLTLTLDRRVTPEWISALQNMGNYSSVLEKGPGAFSFNGDKASVTAREHEIQAVIDNFKLWLPIATRTLRSRLEQAVQREAAAKRDRLRLEREMQEARLRVLRNIKI